MGAYAIRRLLLIFPTLWLLTVAVFFLIRLIPGDVIDLMVEQAPQGQVQLDRAYFERKLGLDVPIFVQYGRWMKGIFTQWPPYLGESMWTESSITQDLAAKIVPSFELGILALIISLIISIPIGIYSALRQDTPLDYMGRTLAILFMALPGFWIATLVIVFPSIWWRWTPSLEYIHFSQNPIGNLGMLLLPATILGMATAGTKMRMLRTLMLEVMRQDYIRTAWSKGLRERVVVFRHALRNALIPLVTMIGAQIPMLIGGSVIMENIFCIPGIGRYMIGAINRRDYLVVSSINLIISTVVMFNNLFIDLSYVWLDPRIRYK